MTLEQLVEQLKKAYGDALRSVVLYGSAAAGEHIPKRSDYNVLVIVDQLDVERLRAVAAVTRAWMDAGNPPPMTLTTAEWRGSWDIFPMEYADILERHRVLHGTPPFDGLAVRPSDLRLQVEREALGRLLQLRRAVIAAGADGRRQLEVLESSLSAVMVVFRGVARLHAQSPPTDYAALSSLVGQMAQLDSAPFARVVRHVRGEAKLPAAEAGTVLAGYLAGMERLVAHLNHFAPAS
ncbi:MAG TPA: nucleotidyltransferase domain-containing protein [Gemmatimonadaceae bacterium]|nr:nucleotidyltransferase domain-containing protein [Gemmatimonadaceae bacterium]